MKKLLPIVTQNSKTDPIDDSTREIHHALIEDTVWKEDVVSWDVQIARDYDEEDEEVM